MHVFLMKPIISNLLRQVPVLGFNIARDVLNRRIMEEEFFKPQKPQSSETRKRSVNDVG